MTKKLSKRELNIVIVTAIVALLYFFQGTILDPLVGFLKRSTGQMDKNQIELKNYLQSVSQQQFIAGQMQAYGGYFAQTPESGSERENDATKVLNQIEELARSHNVTVTALNPKEPTKNDLVTEYRIDITTQSSQRDLILFLYALQTAEGIFYPEKLQVTATKVGEANGVQAQMILVKAVVYASK